jgi:hypothetical protein
LQNRERYRADAGIQHRTDAYSSFTLFHSLRSIRSLPLAVL